MPANQGSSVLVRNRQARAGARSLRAGCAQSARSSRAAPLPRFQGASIRRPRPLKGMDALLTITLMHNALCALDAAAGDLTLAATTSRHDLAVSQDALVLAEALDREADAVLAVIARYERRWWR